MAKRKRKRKRRPKRKTDAPDQLWSGLWAAWNAMGALAVFRRVQMLLIEFEEQRLEEQKRLRVRNEDRHRIRRHDDEERVLTPEEIAAAQARIVYMEKEAWYD